MQRRQFLASAGGAATLAAAALGAQTLTQDAVVHQPTPAPGADRNTADILVQTLIDWGATHVFGVVGDGINPIIEALRKRQDRIAYVGVRHEESAAWMANAMAKHAGRLGVCIGTTGPGAVHLMNGLYDAKLDGVPVLAITGTTFHDLEGMHFMQGVDTIKLMENVAVFNERVNGPAHAVLIANRACRAAMGERGVAHLTIAKDDQGAPLATDKPSMENHGGRTSSAWSVPAGLPPANQIRSAADILNSGQKVAVLAGQGCLNARPELEQLLKLLNAPVAKAFLGKALLPDAHPFTTGGIGHLGTRPSSWIMHNCDTVLILGSTMPWIDYYPKPGQARGVQVDIRADRIGLRYPVEIGLTGDARSTLTALIPLLKQKTDAAFLTEAQARMSQWRHYLDSFATQPGGGKLRPQVALHALNELSPENAIYSMDCGANTHFAARMIEIRGTQTFSGSGTLASMASGLPMAIGAAFAYPNRPSIAVAGDGGFGMLMAELSTAVVHNLNVKVMVINNDSLSNVIFEQKEIGAKEYGCSLGHIDFAAYARCVGAKGFAVARQEELRPAIKAWLNTPGPALIDVAVDVAEEPKKPEDEPA
jgi:pyruvate dehydrogenase (quinone)/pyruvate decarboxylase